MATVRLCLRCGYVNDWRRNSCLVCDTRLQPGFRRSDLKAGMHIEIKRLDRNLTAQRLGKGSVLSLPTTRWGSFAGGSSRRLDFSARPVSDIPAITGSALVTST